MTEFDCICRRDSHEQIYQYVEACPVHHGHSAEWNAGRLAGLKDVSGSFDGFFLGELDHVSFAPDTPVTFWAPKDLPWYRHVIARLRERFFGVPYPTEQLFAGYITDVEVTSKPDGSTVAEGRVVGR